MINDKVSPFLAKKIKSYKLKYNTLSTKERDEVILKIISVLLDDSIPFSGKHRLEQWQKGWKENADAYKENMDEKFLIPKYYGKYDILRINGEFVKAVSKDFEINIVNTLTYYVLDKYFRKYENLYEFGCGPGHNLLKMREINRAATIWGMDWVESSQKGIEQIAKNLGDKKLFGKKFDYFNPDSSFKIAPKSAVFTFASLEQTGEDYKKFVDYILKNKPEVVVNIEPIAEILDPNRLPDYLSIEYFKKRKYINGFLNYLRELESKGSVKIIEAKRTNSGSMFVDGHSLIVWKPL